MGSTMLDLRYKEWLIQVSCLTVTRGTIPTIIGMTGICLSMWLDVGCAVGPTPSLLFFAYLLLNSDRLVAVSSNRRSEWYASNRSTR